MEITKVLTGRDWINTDSFTFTLAAADEATSQAVENGNVKLRIMRQVFQSELTQKDIELPLVISHLMPKERMCL